MFALLTPTRSCTDDLYPVDSEEIINELFSLYNKEKERNDDKIVYLNIEQILSIIINQPFETTCGIGEKKIAIKFNGDLFPCHRFIDSPNYKLGNVNSGHYFNTYYKKQFKDNSKNCSKCLIKSYCVGGCPYEILTRRNQNYIQSDYCNFRKSIIKKCLNIITGSHTNIPCDFTLKGITKDNYRNMRKLNYTKNSSFKMPSDIKCIDLGDEGVLYLQGNLDNRFIVNTTTLAVIDLIKGNLTIENIVKSIAFLSGNPPSEIEKDIISIIEELYCKGLINVA